MTYNIRLDTANDGANAWDFRKKGLVDQIRFHEPNVLGIQEGLYHQVEYLDASLPDYSYVGVGRDDGEKGGEFSAIFYDTRRLERLEHGTFWLSESPEQVSIGWDAALERICTYAAFKDLTSLQTFWVFNTHFDHEGVVAREESAVLIIAQIDRINVQGHPYLLMGDFNSVPGSAPILAIMARMNDAREEASLVAFGPRGTVRFRPDETAGRFGTDQPVTRRVDYIFTSKGNWNILKHAVLTDSINLKYYSDHLPVLVEATPLARKEEQND
ncbi:MAG: endonuclease/exonuclease/phosphatase family protein [Gammaproteobacteria bacterium]|nr:endonuclease/exonuclease/phosphatase family protein [Gammaproteobacteria bacterium]